ncbi:MAG: hypothetical protein HOB70_00600 [Chloroflexi bacterium]|nr:hypothetical protein [Chloroflexota bacterium]
MTKKIFTNVKSFDLIDLRIDFGNGGIRDYLSLKKTIKYIQSILGKQRFGTITLAGDSLLIPGYMEGHLSLEFVNDLLQMTFGRAKNKYLEVTLSSSFSDYYLSNTHFLNGESYTFFKAASRMEYFLVGIIEEKKIFLKSNQDLFSGIGASKDGSLSYDEFLSLFYEMHKIVDKNGKLIQTNTIHHEKNIRTESIIPKNCNTPGILATPEDENSAIINDLLKVLKQKKVFNELETIELLLVLTGAKKSMRTSISKYKYNRVKPLLEQYGLQYHLDKELKKYRNDWGKGGWSNLYFPEGDIDSSKCDYLLYIAFASHIPNEAALAEQKGDDSFGDILSYPMCCRTAFERNLPIASKKQGDLVPLIADQTLGSEPWSFLMNTSGRYFLKGFISFYPCSYTCKSALKIAENYFNIIEKYLPDLTQESKEIMSSPILYTEYRGIYLFRNSKVENDIIHYDPAKVMTTTDNSLCKAIRNCDTLHISEKDDIILMNGKNCVKRLRGPNIRIMIFDQRYR